MSLTSKTIVIGLAAAAMTGAAAAAPDPWAGVPAAERPAPGTPNLSGIWAMPAPIRALKTTDGKAPPLAPQLARLTQRLEGLNVAGMVTATVVEFDSPWNWKVMVENFMESYHHIGPHAGTLQRSNPALGTYEGDGDHLYSVLENPPADSENASLLVGAIFPFTLIAFSETGTPSGVWYEMDRISHANFRLRVHFLAPPEVAADPSRASAFRDAFVAIHLEDIPACEGVQRGVTSPLYAPGPLSHLEASLLRFHRFLKARMAP